jgi:protein ImuB
VEPDEAAVQQALERLAAWCYQYSNQVYIPGDRNGLFLEAGASERLFGLTARLGKRLEQELGYLGYHAMTGSAPTPEAAWLAAREGLHITKPGHVRQQLGSFPLALLHLDTAQQVALERMGFRLFRDLLRLPRKALIRRFGPALPDYLERVLGVRPDPRALYRPPETFSSRLELPAEIHNCQALLFPLKRLLEELCGVLRGGDTAVQSLRVELGHEDHENSLLKLGLQSPTQSADRLMTVLGERLERLSLPQAVREIRLETPTLLKFNAGQHSLFQDTPAEQRQDIEHLAERLQARLGNKSVTGLTGVEECPEPLVCGSRIAETCVLAHCPHSA